MTTTCTAWRNNAQYGPDVEVWARITTLPGMNNQVRLYARLQQAGTPAFDGYMLRTNQLAGRTRSTSSAMDNGAITTTPTIPGARRRRHSAPAGYGLDGRGMAAQRRLVVAARLCTDSTYAAAGSVGVGLRGTTGRLDDFGARTLGVAPATAPSAPQSLQATAGKRPGLA